MCAPDGTYKLLEVNCGPVVSAILELGEKYRTTISGKQCLNYGDDIAEMIFNRALLSFTNTATETTNNNLEPSTL